MIEQLIEDLGTDKKSGRVAAQKLIEIGAECVPYVLDFIEQELYKNSDLAIGTQLSKSRKNTSTESLKRAAFVLRGLGENNKDPERTVKILFRLLSMKDDLDAILEKAITNLSAYAAKEFYEIAETWRWIAYHGGAPKRVKTLDLLSQIYFGKDFSEKNFREFLKNFEEHLKKLDSKTVNSFVKLFLEEFSENGLLSGFDTDELVLMSRKKVTDPELIEKIDKLAQEKLEKYDVLPYEYDFTTFDKCETHEAILKHAYHWARYNNDLKKSSLLILACLGMYTKMFEEVTKLSNKELKELVDKTKKLFEGSEIKGIADQMINDGAINVIKFRDFRAVSFELGDVFDKKTIKRPKRRPGKRKEPKRFRQMKAAN